MSEMPPPSGLTSEERAQLFRGESLNVDRSAALRAGSDRVPRKVIAWMVAGFVLLGTGGVLGEHYFSNSSAASSTPTTTLAGIVTPSLPPGRALGGSLTAFIGLTTVSPTAAPEIVLRSQNSRVWALRAQRGKLVVLTFFNSTCRDVCRVVRSELATAQDDLGTRANNVVFVAINTDPFHTSASGEQLATSAPAPRHFIFLNGPLRTLNATWANYGVTVTVGSTHAQLAHNNICYLIDQHGNVRARLIPFANEDSHGRYSLPAAEISRFAKGVARAVSSLEQ